MAKASIRMMETFIAVAESATFVEAAKRLHQSQSAVSKSLAELERTLSTTLVVRGRNGHRLTPDGIQLLRAAKTLTKAVDHAWTTWEDYADGQAGNVNIAFLPSAGALLVPSAIAEFAASHPRVRLGTTDNVATALTELAYNQTIDFMVTYLPTASGMGHIAYEGLIEEPLFEEDYVAVARRGHPILELEEVTLADICRYPLALASRDTSIGPSVEAILSTSGLGYTELCRVRTIGAIGGMIDTGLAVSVVPSLLVKLFAFADVHARPISDVTHKRVTGILRPSGQRLCAPAADLAAILRTHISAMPGGIPGTSAADESGSNGMR